MAALSTFAHFPLPSYPPHTRLFAPSCRALCGLLSLFFLPPTALFLPSAPSISLSRAFSLCRLVRRRRKNITRVFAHQQEGTIPRDINPPRLSLILLPLYLRSFADPIFPYFSREYFTLIYTYKISFFRSLIITRVAWNFEPFLLGITRAGDLGCCMGTSLLTRLLPIWTFVLFARLKFSNGITSQFAPRF